MRPRTTYNCTHLCIQNDKQERENFVKFKGSFKIKCNHLVNMFFLSLLVGKPHNGH